MQVVVIGGGLIGVASAWYLLCGGHKVTLVEEAAEVAMGTSHANGGQLSAGQAQVWSRPSMVSRFLDSLLRDDKIACWQPHFSIGQWLSLVRLLYSSCSKSGSQANSRRLIKLALYNRQLLESLSSQFELNYARHSGILQCFEDPTLWREARQESIWLNSQGCDCVVLSSQECVDLEPALYGRRKQLLGGLHILQDASGDARAFTQQLFECFKSSGGHAMLSSRVQGWAYQNGKVNGLKLSCNKDTDNIYLKADYYVIAAGVQSVRLAEPLGIKLPILPLKGHSLSLPVKLFDCVPKLSITDPAYAMVCSPLKTGLRIAGMVGLSGSDTGIHIPVIQALLRRAAELFSIPNLAESDLLELHPWSGLRPMTPSNVPMIGPSHHANVYINTGHGALGWTTACASGRILADMISGEESLIDVSSYHFKS